MSSHSTPGTLTAAGYDYEKMSSPSFSAYGMDTGHIRMTAKTEVHADSLESGDLVLLPVQPLSGWITFGKVTQAQLYNEKIELNYLKGPFQLLQSVILITTHVFYL